MHPAPDLRLTSSARLGPGWCQCGCDKPTKSRYARGHQNRRWTNYLVNPETLCWEWKGAQTPGGYGYLTAYGRNWVAHRFFFERQGRKIPEGMDLDHLCRNRLCVNPDHLEPVTRATNIQRGDKARLDAEKVAEIRASDEPTSDLMGRFGVSRSTINTIRRGETWKS